MRIGAPSVPALPVSLDYRRDAVGERRSQPREPEAAAEREVTRVRARSGAAAANSANRQVDGSYLSESWSQHTRTALLSYASNGPTIEERLGVELVGIDLYA